jgi:Zn-dependent protease with chaperone function
MAISYSLRMVCVALVALGLIQISMELVFWAAAQLIFRLLAPLSARSRERSLYLIQLTPFLVAIALTCLVCVPGYIHNETNFAAEAVGWPCLLLAAGVLAWCASSILRGVRVMVRTAVFANACKTAGAKPLQGPSPTPIVSLPDAAYRVALVGLVHPRIFISDDLLADGGLSPLALDLVLEHEQSHAIQGDNWKLLSLYCLPRFNLPLAGNGSWLHQWQSAAEWAADDDAVRGDSSRALLLAQTLVAFARRVATPSAPATVSTAFVCGDKGLELRVDRLLELNPATADGSPRSHRRSAPDSARLSAALALSAMLLGGATAIAALTPWLHDLSEHLLHLG